MWKCPSCGSMNRSEVCTGCGLERKAYSRYSPQMSGARLFFAVIASILVIAAIFFAVNAAIDQRNRRRAKEYKASSEASIENTNEKTPEADASGVHFS